MEPCFGGRRHTVVTGPGGVLWACSEEETISFYGLKSVLGQLRPCAEAGGEWLCATVTSSPWGGGSGVGICLALFCDSGEHS